MLVREETKEIEISMDNKIIS